MGKWKRIALLMLLLVTASLICIYNIPFSVNRTIPALEVSLDEGSIIDKREIVINGTYHFNLFTDDLYVGMFSISGYPVINEQHQIAEIIVTKKGSVLEYKERTGDKWYLFGRIYSTLYFDDFAICIYQHNDKNGSQGNYSILDAKIIVTNSTNYYDALQTLSSVFKLQVENAYS